MKKSIKNLASKGIKNINAVKGGDGKDDDIDSLMNNLGGTNNLRKRGGI